MLSKLLMVHYFKVLEEKDFKCAVITTHSGFIKTAGKKLILNNWNPIKRLKQGCMMNCLKTYFGLFTKDYLQ